MESVATINGTRVYSDKQVSRVVNARVNFTDGSWCDVATGEVHNTGPGYINLGTSVNDNSSQVVTSVPTSYQASALQLENLSADVTIEVTQRTEIEYSVSGPEDLIKAIKVSLRSGVLVLASERPRGFEISDGGLNISVGGNIFEGDKAVYRSSSQTIVVGDLVVGKSLKNPVRVTLKVPEGTPVTSILVSGDVNLGDTKGPLSASVQSGKLSAGRVTNVHLSILGSGKITVGEVNGSATVQVQGSGEICIGSGHMSSLMATVQGSGDVVVSGITETASLSLMGSGDIWLAHSVQPPIKNALGSGRIRVDRIG
jgi:hypothetical protein